MRPLALLTLALPASSFAAEGVLTLESTPWVGGSQTTVTVSDAQPGDLVRLLLSPSIAGAGLCPAVTAPDCLELSGSLIILGSQTADASGTATFNLVPPDPVPAPAAEIQGVVLLPKGADTSNSVIVTLNSSGSDLDGDGLVASDEILEGTDPNNPDTDGGGANDGGEIDAGTDPLDATDDITWTAVIEPLFQYECGSCHMNGNVSGGLNFDDPATDLINVRSNDVPSMDEIEPGDPDNSYLWHKINGTQGTVGGSGLQMPRLQPPLLADEIDDVTTWILQGAPI